MNSQNENIEILLQNRIYLYELMHAVFSGVPNEELIHLISQPVTQEAFLLLSEADDDLMAKMAHFTSLQDGKLAADPAYLEQVKSEYTKLLIGPGKMIAYPWESTYNGSETMLFQESTLRVRQAYRKYGYLPEEYPHVPDDHIALELHFLSKLSSLVLDAYKEGNRERALSVLNDQKVFMKYHIRNWL
ncbi:MAG: molecular chaperone TorD family protein, partial [Verrucomicrobia bacterium]|nr:molecular chaperone TorD family protein [Verrucomicrobiota bacterium]